MGSGFKSRGVHHWENSLRLCGNTGRGLFCFLPHYRNYRARGTKKRGAGFREARPRFSYAGCRMNDYLAALSIRAPALLGVVENWLASSRTTAFSS